MDQWSHIIPEQHVGMPTSRIYSSSRCLLTAGSSAGARPNVSSGMEPSEVEGSCRVVTPDQRRM